MNKYRDLWNKEVTDKIDKNDVYDTFYTIEGHKQIIPEEEILLKEIKKNSKVLDIGCCYGRLMRLFPNSYGIDVSKEMLKRNPYKNRIKLMDASEGLKFNDETFDDVFLFRVLLHCNGKGDRERIIKDAMRVLKKGGHLYIDVSNTFNFIWFLKRIYWRMKGVLVLISAKELTLRKTRRLMKKLGLKYEEILNGKQTIFKVIKEDLK